MISISQKKFFKKMIKLEKDSGFDHSGKRKVRV